MLKLSDIDTSRCLFDPKQSDLLTITKDIEPLNKELSYRVSRKAILTYIILLYDQNSTLRKEVRNFAARKGIAIQMSGIKMDKNGRFERPIELILEGKNELVNSMIVKYISLQNNPRWGQLIAYETLYHLELAKIQNGAYGKASEVIKSIDMLAESIDRLTEEIVGGKNEVESVLSGIYKEVTKNISITPEAIASYLEESGDLPEWWNPYSEINEKDGKVKSEYKVDKIKYVGAE
jgi:uncharacterized protein YpmS